jgi:microcystin-dependent protein
VSIGFAGGIQVQPYVGEIRLFAGNFAPNGWMFCEGQTLPISENETLFTLIGTTYGGDGQETFNLPNLASRIPIHMGTGPDGTTYQLGEMAGTESETLTTQQIPTHDHALIASTAQANVLSPEGAVLAKPTSTQPGVNAYVPTASATADHLMHASSITSEGGSQPHDNTQPFLVMNYIISLYGVFPTQT